MNIYGTEKGPFFWNKNAIIVKLWNSLTKADYDAVRLRLN